MNRRQKIIVSITGIFIVLLALVGLTYAYFLTRITGNENDKSISVTTANLQLVYADGNGILETGNLEPSDDYITFLDGDGNEHESKIFTVTNNGNAIVEGYKVYLENVQNQFERKDDLVYTLTCKSYVDYDEETKAISGECTGVNTETTFPSVITNIVSNDIAVGITHEYELKVKYKEMNVDQSVDMNKLLSAKINIYDSATKFLVREIMDNALSTATVTYNKSNYIEPTLQDGTNYTIPAHATSLENERILTYTMDDYGTSYYYRGNVEDNYVNYAGMCWRIVRIAGDGSVKIVLEDQDEACSTSMNGNWGIPTTTGGTTYTGNYGYELKNVDSDSSNEYIMSYLKPVTNADKSMARAFYDFQKDKLEDYKSKLKSGNWCLADKAYTQSGSSPNYTYTLLEEYNYSSNMYYDSYVRLYGNSTKEPTLKCTGTIMDKFESVTYNETEIIEE